MTVGMLETLVLEFAAVEQGGIVQNLGLMTQALGLGGFAHFAAHPWIWEQELGFRLVDLPTSRVMGMNLLLRLGTRVLGRDLPIPTPVGLERGGDVLIRPFCPPYYPSMREAVLAFVEAKYGEHGTFRAADSTGAWKDPSAVRAGIPAYSDEAIEATIAYCSVRVRAVRAVPGGERPVPHRARLPGRPPRPRLLRALLHARGAERHAAAGRLGESRPGSNQKPGSGPRTGCAARGEARTIATAVHAPLS